MGRTILALDQGTTSSRAIAFNEEGQIVAVAQRELMQSYPQPGWVEHDPEEIWRSQLEVAQEVIAHVGPIAAIGITNQRETTILWNRATGEPLHPAIVWQDRRTAVICDSMAEHARLIAEKTGLVLDSYFSATKLSWLLDQIPGAKSRAEKGELAFGTVDSWLVWKLTGEHVTDVSNASRTMLFNIHTLAWDQDLLNLFGIPPEVLPRIVPSSGHMAHAKRLGAGIYGIAGDQQAATFGQICFAPGMAKSTYGTGCFLLMNAGVTPPLSKNRLLSTVGWDLKGATTYALEGSVFIAGAAVQWLRDELGIIRSADDTESLARSLPDNGGVYLVPAFVGLGAPYWDPHAKGALVGLTRGAGKAQLARAALESIAYQCRDVLDAMARDCGHPIEELRVDGGAARNDWLMQFQADILGRPVVRPKVTETTALGAAFLAGIGAGIWRPEDLPQLWQADRAFGPRMEPEQRERLYGGWQEAVQKARG